MNDLCPVCGASWECEHLKEVQARRLGEAKARLDAIVEGQPHFRRRAPRGVHKLIQGAAFDSVGELAQWIADGNWTYIGRKPMHHGWMRSQQLGTLVASLHNACRALPNPDYVEEPS